MTEKRVIALFAALAAGLGAGGASFTTAGSQSVDWSSPVGVGSIMISAGLSIGAALAAYKGAAWERTTIGAAVVGQFGHNG